jgi:hypothetical protein
MTEPTNEELNELEQESLEDLEEELDAVVAQPAITNPWDDPLELLYQQASPIKPKATKFKPPSMAEAAAKAERRLREVYSNPENWQRVRGVALIDKTSSVLLGNFSEYQHIMDSSARKFLREHEPISIQGTEVIEGYLGVEVEARFKAVSWDKEQEVAATIQLDEMMVEAPDIQLRVFTRFGGIIRTLLVHPTQLASPSGNVILQLPEGTDIWRACSTDTKIRIRGVLQ